jgi:hypothetical protein
VAGQKTFKPERRAALHAALALGTAAAAPPDPRYIEAVTANPAYDTVFLNMHSAGIGVTLKKR